MSKNSSRDWLERELHAFAAKLTPGSLILDAGAGDQVYAPIFQHTRYEAADFEKVDKVYKKPTFSCDLASIPVEDGRYDAVVCTQVLEHLPEPLVVLRELHRTLKPGGSMILTCPLWYEEHERPYDFYRYTQFGLKHLVEKAGFVVEEVRWLDGYMASVTHQLRLMKRHLPWKPSDFGGGLQGVVSAGAFAVFRLFLSPLRWAANAADSRNRYVGGGLPKNYLMILSKPS
ncbi:class I SAM-dependent methyltransferase [Mesorhizobium sp. B1-1-8]|uniref:class I SAM-dependent methyltransferase n=1 Tax=Mesorhizobium sp. B1-1-8 TaxID=2589976 RepID=UPI001125F7F8|nr:class I SAM-dependent methyltransferase [Mesorhizobium sp. B1-1-8]UCI05686.1 class I SAM-dependent methyltransferase [Mesorhizobium sp. B1-1-8]